MKMIAALVIAYALPYALMKLHLFGKQMRHEAELFRMGCHPRQRQLQAKWKIA